MSVSKWLFFPVRSPCFGWLIENHLNRWYALPSSSSAAGPVTSQDQAIHEFSACVFDAGEIYTVIYYTEPCNKQSVPREHWPFLFTFYRHSSGKESRNSLQKCMQLVVMENATDECRS